MILKYIKFLESLKDINIIQSPKTDDSYHFLESHLKSIISKEDYINNESLLQVCAFFDKKLVGVRCFRMKDGKIHLNYSAVDVDYRKTGINQGMFNTIRNIAEKNDIQLITVNVRESNVNSLKSLLKSGFQINTNAELKYPDGEKKIALYFKLKEKNEN